MKYTTLFRSIAMATILCYCAVLAQAGQVITDEHRVWAKQRVEQEGKLVGPPTTTNSIAVLNFNNNSQQTELDPLQKGLALMLITDLAKVEQIQVVERVRMQALLDEMDLSPVAPEDDETIFRVGKLLATYYVTRGNIITEQADNLLINLSLLDVPFTSGIDLPPAAGTVETLIQMEKSLLFNIIQQMNIELTPGKRAELEEPMSSDTAALLDLFQGLDFSDKDQYAEAAEMYEQALVKDPDLKIAESGLQELNDMGLVAADEVPMLEEGPPPPEPEGGLSTTVKVGIGAAALAVAGVGAYYAFKEDDDPPPPPDPDTLNPPSVDSVDPSEGSTLNCSSGSVTFAFSEPMNRTGQVFISVNGATLDNFFNTKQSWDDQWNEENFTVSWNHPAATNQYCTAEPGADSGGMISITLSNFQDSSGSALSGKSRFSYRGRNFRQ